jgi:hypothetical protein
MLEHWPISEGFELRLAILSACGIIDSENTVLSSRFSKLATSSHINNASSDYFKIFWERDKVVVLYNGERVEFDDSLMNHPFASYHLALSGPILQLFHTENTDSKLQRAIANYLPGRVLSEMIFDEKYFFHTVLPQNGDEFLRWMNWDASILATVVRGLVRKGAHTLSFWTKSATTVIPYLYEEDKPELSSRFVAWAGRHPKYGYEVCINGSALTSLDDLILLLFSESENLPRHILSAIEGNVDSEKEYAYLPCLEKSHLRSRLVYFSNRLDITLAESLNALAKVITPMPLNILALRYCASVRTMAYLWITFHEESHVNHGHVDYLESQNIFTETNERSDGYRKLEEDREIDPHSSVKNESRPKDEIDRKNSIISQIFELHADVAGFVELIALENLTHIKSNYSSDIATSYDLYIYSVIDAISVCFTLLSSLSSNEDIHYATHPPAQTRLVCMLVSILRTLGNMELGTLTPIVEDPVVPIQDRINKSEKFKTYMIKHRGELIERMVRNAKFLSMQLLSQANQEINYSELIQDILYLSETDDEFTVAKSKVKTSASKWLLYLRGNMNDEIERMLTLERAKGMIFHAFQGLLK